MSVKYYSIVCVFTAFVLIGAPAGFSQYRKQLSIGDPCPDIKISNIVNHSLKQARISDFKGKLLILDFWATWCTPCIRFFKETDSLQRKFKGKVEILPVTMETQKEALQLLDKYYQSTGIRVPSVTDDSILSTLFIHNSLPHEVWIDANGIIRAITSNEEVTEENINRLLSNQLVNLPVKVDKMEREFKTDEPVLTGNQNIHIKKDELMFNSVFTKYIDGLHSATSNGSNFITCINVPIQTLYQIAFGEYKAEFMPRNRTILRVKDSALFNYFWDADKARFNNWKWKNLYCYEFHSEDTTLTKMKFKTMQEDLNRYFSTLGIEGKIDRQRKKCYVLQRTSSVDKIKTKGVEPDFIMNAYNLQLRNKRILNFVAPLQAMYLQTSELPLVDETGYEGNVDMSINCDLSNVDAINKELKKYDLRILQAEREIDMIVITQKSDRF